MITTVDVETAAELFFENNFKPRTDEQAYSFRSKFDTVAKIKDYFKEYSTQTLVKLVDDEQKEKYLKPLAP